MDFLKLMLHLIMVLIFITLLGLRLVSLLLMVWGEDIVLLIYLIMLDLQISWWLFMPVLSVFCSIPFLLILDGRRVLMIERDLSEPDKIVGELLQPGGYLKLIEPSLQDCVKEIDAQRVLGYALSKDGQDTRLSYPLEKFHSDVAGRSFHNGRFIQRMREKAASLPKLPNRKVDEKELIT